jgi:hypothetical protein
MRRMIWSMIGASIALGAVWIYPPSLPPETVACVDACASACGLEMDPPRELTLAETVRMRRLLVEPGP